MIPEEYQMNATQVHFHFSGQPQEEAPCLPIPSILWEPLPVHDLRGDRSQPLKRFIDYLTIGRGQTVIPYGFNDVVIQ